LGSRTVIVIAPPLCARTWPTLMHADAREAEVIAHLKDAAVFFAGIDEEPLLRPEIWKLVQW
jgi:hypothetical protein